jgi:predicted DNA-binding transcriptional regulator AlpA
VSGSIPHKPKRRTTISDLAMRLQRPAATKFTPKNGDLLDANGVAHELGISRSTLERALIRPDSRLPRPFSPGGTIKRLWQRRDIENYRAALALLGRKPQ